MHSIVVKFKKPECQDACENCSYLKKMDASFGYEYGSIVSTHHQEEWECEATISDLECYGECFVIEREIDDTFVYSELIQRLEIEIL